jgi:hypothetical protein
MLPRRACAKVYEYVPTFEVRLNSDGEDGDEKKAVVVRRQLTEFIIGTNAPLSGPPPSTVQLPMVVDTLSRMNWGFVDGCRVLELPRDQEIMSAFSLFRLRTCSNDSSSSSSSSEPEVKYPIFDLAEAWDEIPCGTIAFEKDSAIEFVMTYDSECGKMIPPPHGRMTLRDRDKYWQRYTAEFHAVALFTEELRIRMQDEPGVRYFGEFCKRVLEAESKLVSMFFIVFTADLQQPSLLLLLQKDIDTR